MSDPKNLMLAGDWHGNSAFAAACFELAATEKCDAIFQLGDFGYWEHAPEGGAYLAVLEQLAAKHDVDLYWLDGNHENHTLLRHSYGEGLTNDEWWPIRPRVLYSPRGHRWEWNGVGFMSVGGAFSIDKQYRKWGDADYPFAGGYWPEEMISPEEEAFACRFEGGPSVKVLLSHDAPLLPGEVRYGTSGYKVDHHSESNRAVIRRLSEATSPRRHYHGHYHVAYTDEYTYNGGFTTKVRGLDADVNYDVERATQIIGLSDGSVHERRHTYRAGAEPHDFSEPTISPIDKLREQRDGEA